MSKITLAVVFFGIFIEVTFSQTNFFLPELKLKDSTQQSIAAYTSLDGVKRIPPENFLFANHRKYMMDGQTPPLKNHINVYKMIGITTVYSAWWLAIHIKITNESWAGKTYFRVIEDSKYTNYADKAGHFFMGNISAYVASEGFLFAGFSYKKATLYGMFLGLAFMTYIEIGDGFGENWGFSPSDELANIAGATYYYFQQHTPVLQNFQTKFSYIPSSWFGEPQIITRDKNFADDYNSQAHYISINVHNLFFKDNKNAIWPKWLNVAVGYGVKNVDHFPLLPTSRFYLALDYNMVELLPDGGSFWNWFKQSLNFLKFPAPTLEISDVTRFRIFYPFSIRIGNFKF